MRVQNKFGAHMINMYEAAMNTIEGNTFAVAL